MTSGWTDSDAKYFGSIDEACGRVLAPLEAWAGTGFAEGALDLAISRQIAKPPLISARVLNKVWEQALGEWNSQTMTDEDRAEASARFEFAHSLLNRLMTRESEIRDTYYRARRNGMTVRTLVLAAAIATWTVLSIWATWWIAWPATFLIGLSLGTCWKRLSDQLRAAPKVGDPVKLILSVLPWNAAGVAKTG